VYNLADLMLGQRSQDALSDFGTITSAYDALQVQLGAKVLW